MTWKSFSSPDPTYGIYTSEINHYKEHGNTEEFQLHLLHLKPAAVLAGLYNTSKRTNGHSYSFEDWINSAVINNDEYMNKMKTALLSRKRVVPVIVFVHRNGGINLLNEGRHRTIAASDLKLKTIPVIDINKNY